MAHFLSSIKQKTTSYFLKYSGMMLWALAFLWYQPAAATELIDAVIPAKLKESYKARQLKPLTCIKTTNKFIDEVKLVSTRIAKISSTEALTGSLNSETPSTSQAVTIPNHAPTQLLASCYIELEDYQSSLALLKPLLATPSVTSDEIHTLTIIANNIPETERPELNNNVLIDMLTQSLALTKKSKKFEAKNLINILNLSIAKLALDTNQYRLANQALTQARENIQPATEPALNAWLAYYYAHYYDQINQQQLSVSYFQAANSIAKRLGITQLNSLVNESLSAFYQKKHRIQKAISFASQRVELLQGSENYVQQADSLIKLAVLYRQAKHVNQALIYLFNALDLVENKHRALVANVYLELGKTYAAFPDKLAKNTNFAQKYLQNARRQFHHLSKLAQETESILLLAKLNIANKDTGLAILQLEEVLELANNKFPALRMSAFEMLALGYEQSGNHQQANFYYKSFHALQNKIKEGTFTLQQLKIDEQFQLIEQTQQKIQLETQNNQLLLKNNLFQDVAYWAMSFLFLVFLLLLFTFFRFKKLAKKMQLMHRKIRYHPRSKLPMHQDQIKQQALVYQGRPLFYALVHIPFLNDLNEAKGLFKAEALEHELGSSLTQTFTPNTRVTQVRDNQLLFISEQEHYQDAAQFVQTISDFFQHFAEKNNLSSEISSGVVAFPFLNNVSRAISPERMLNLTSLALFGACQLREKTQQSSWLELYAIAKIQPAFFNGDLWLLGQAGINSGIVKLKSSHPDINIKWPKLNR